MRVLSANESTLFSAAKRGYSYYTIYTGIYNVGTNGEEENVTVLVTANASGMLVPPKTVLGEIERLKVIRCVVLHLLIDDECIVPWLLKKEINFSFVSFGYVLILFMWLQNCYVGDRKWRLPKTFCTVI
jgi:hypothetical protein